MEQLGIIGAGRAAQALAIGLADHSAEPPLMWGRSLERVGAASAATGSEVAVSIDRIASDCDVIAIAVSDDATSLVVDELAHSLPAGSTPFAFHLSGRSGAALLAPLRAAGAMTAAIHPAMTFTGDPHGEVRRMVGARFAITGSTIEATERAKTIVAALHGTSVEIPEEKRALYHAALCHASNHLVTLIAGASGALKESGVDDPSALLAPLVRAALDNSLAKGFAGLSGPLLRGDSRTIEGHMEALAVHHPELFLPYRAMALATLDELERAGPSDVAALRLILDSPRTVP